MGYRLESECWTRRHLGDLREIITDDTRESCWLCDRERGELCHVHDRANEPVPEVPLVWCVPISEERPA